ncbi:hypothetical protein [Fimbriiglobus ruber]|uniref:Uncharacterized protein n=1 Tax=Fimbriiglobus ruber TaxID=1908690 RepID=A0A225E9I1_9BACT|nr:hypothetical protein [Fimbriiglobus ruber]OWK46706.1 hypothetical protein FRUB_00405 [Fimbriiglobus ruber]
MSLALQLRSWQFREWLYRAAWGFARWAVVVLIGLTAACTIDWLVDRVRDTPLALRIALTAAQLALYVSLAYLLLVRLHVPPIDALAVRAEHAIPAFGHRLVTALQLNRAGARTEGMSKELIREVTREAEEMAAHHRLSSLAESFRLWRAFALLLPVGLLVGAFAAYRTDLVTALVMRQCLLNVDIPRSIKLTNATPELWPAGDEVELRFDVTGPVSDDTTGTVTVSPDGQPSESFELSLIKRTDDGTAIFGTTLPPSSVRFTFRARVGEGRMRQPGTVSFEPRPTVKEIQAWVLLPAFVDPTGKNRYERFQPQGEVVALAESSVRIEIATTKPVTSAKLVLLARDAEGKENEVRRVDMKIDEQGDKAGALFDLPPRANGYRVEVKDKNQFANTNPPRRGITIMADDPPRVNLLTEVLKNPDPAVDPGPLDDYEVTGMPLGIGGQVQVGYAARSPLGLSRAQIVYRVNDGPWSQLPLKKTDADESKLGKFIPELGLFTKSGDAGHVEFYQIPSDHPDSEPSGLEAGGRFNFQTAALVKTGDDGKQSKLEIGDRVEYYVEVFDRNPAPGRQPGRSESRIKTVVTQSQLQAWLSERDQSRDRLKQLEERQRGVFMKKKPQ